MCSCRTQADVEPQRVYEDFSGPRLRLGPANNGAGRQGTR